MQIICDYGKDARTQRKLSSCFCVTNSEPSMGFPIRLLRNAQLGKGRYLQVLSFATRRKCVYTSNKYVQRMDQSWNTFWGVELSQHDLRRACLGTPNATLKLITEKVFGQHLEIPKTGRAKNITPCQLSYMGCIYVGLKLMPPGI